MDSAKNQLVDKLHSANNVLVTVSRDPSVDQLAACIGLTLLLNKLDKHATAVFSGAIPSTIEFLQPEETIEKNTDSLRDFIIALDKSKADKLRYKVEDQLVRIFITPYRTSINQDDLEFSQGDFNVDLVIALGVQQQEDLDQAITAHGRILHDATVASVNLSTNGELGSINWTDPQASSLSELVADLARALGENLLDPQIATALLTGIVAQTERFSNERTTPQTMSVSSELMAAGANQQLVATKLEEPAAPPPSVPHDDSSAAPPPARAADDGTLEIDHNPQADKPEEPPEAEALEKPAPEAKPPDKGDSADASDSSDKDMPEDFVLPPVKDPDEPLPPIVPLQTQTPAAAPPELDTPGKPAPEDEEDLPSTASRLITEPPMLGGTLTANSQPEQYDPSTDPLSSVTLPSEGGSPPDALAHPAPASAPPPPAPDAARPHAALPAAPPPPEPAPAPAAPPVAASQSPAPVLSGFTPPPPAWVPPSDDALNFDSTGHQAAAAPDPHETLTELEEEVHSPHLQTPDVSEARDEVEKALNDAPEPPEGPIAALNAQPLGAPLHPESEAPGAGDQPAPTIITPSSPPLPGQSEPTPPPRPPADETPDLPGVSAASFEEPPAKAAVTDTTAPPPVPPPIPYQFGTAAPTEPPRAT